MPFLKSKRFPPLKCYFPNISLSQLPISWQSQQFASTLGSSSDPKPLLTLRLGCLSIVCARVWRMAGGVNLCARVGRSKTSISCPVYHSSLDYFETGFLAEPGTRLVVSKPQPFSCLCSQQLRAYKCTQPHPALCIGARILTWVHMLHSKQLIC